MFIDRILLAYLATISVGVAQQYTISTFAGGAPPPTPINAVNAPIGPANGVAADADGNVYFTTSDLCVFKLDRNGVLTRVAGTSRLGYSGDGGAAVNAQFIQPWGITIDSNGNIYVTDSTRVRKISSDGTIATVAGGGSVLSGDGGLATVAQLASPYGVAVDTAGNLYIADAAAGLIRKVSTSGVISTVAGSGVAGYSGDGGPATSAALNAPVGIATDTAGNLYIADKFNNRIRKVSPNGIITTVAGSGGANSSGDGGNATSAQLINPAGVAVDSAGNLYIAQLGDGIRKVTLSTGIISTIPGVAGTAVALDRSGNLYVASVVPSGSVARVSTSGAVTTVAGNGKNHFSGDGGPAMKAQLLYPQGIAVDDSGNVYIADSGNLRIRKVSSGGSITTFAGTGAGADGSGDGGPALNAQIFPLGIATDQSGNVLVSEGCSYPTVKSSRVRKISSNGIITTIAGNGSCGFSGDGGPATNAQLNGPNGMTVDSLGNIYIADTGNRRVRKISTNGIITTVAGNGNPPNGSYGDGLPATSALLFGPIGVAVDGNGNLYIADTTLRKVSPDGTITTVLTQDRAGVLGVVIDSSNNIYVAEGCNCGAATGEPDGGLVRKISANGASNIIAGTGTRGYSGDGGPATDALLDPTLSIAADRSGNVYLSDYQNSAIRLLQPVIPALSVTSVANGASNAAGPISVGEIVVIYGSGLGPSQIATAHVGENGQFASQLAGTTVSFNGTLATIIYSSSTQVAAVVPYGISGNTVAITVTYLGQTSVTFSAPLAPSAPGVFTADGTGKGQAAAVNQDNALNTVGTPARIGDVIVLFATGEGQTTPVGVDGKPATVPLPKPTLPIAVSIGGQPAQVQYAGGAPGEIAGLMQINAVIPGGIQAGGSVPVTVQVGNVSSQQGVTIAVR